MSEHDPVRRHLRDASAVPIPETCRCSLCDRPDKSAVERHMDEIAALLGCPHWEYAGQVVNDVRGLLAYVERLEAALVEMAESADMNLCAASVASAARRFIAFDRCDALGREIAGRKP